MNTKFIFTDEAEQLFEEHLSQIKVELRNSTINEALQSRGEPIEVTASDVKRAISNTYLVRKKLKPDTDLILRLYMVMGIIIFVFAVVYPVFQNFVSELTSSQILILIVGIAGLILSITSYFLRYYLMTKKVNTKDSNFTNSEISSIDKKNKSSR